MLRRVPTNFRLKNFFYTLILLFPLLSYAQIAMDGQFDGYKYVFTATIGDAIHHGTDIYTNNLSFKIDGNEIFTIVHTDKIDYTNIFLTAYRVPTNPRYIGVTSSADVYDVDGGADQWYFQVADIKMFDAMVITQGFNDNNDYLITVTYKLPEKFLHNGFVNVQASLTDNYDGVTYLNQLGLTAPVLPLQNEIHITPGCSSIDIAWDQLQINPPFSISDFKYRIYKGPAINQQIAGNATAGTVNKVSEKSDYTVSLLFNGEIIGSKTGFGTPTELLPIPADLQATTNKCDNTIDLKWQWPQSSPEKFRIYYSTIDTATTYTFFKEVSGTKRSYTATTGDALAIGQKYYFQIAAKGGACGLEGSSSEEAVLGFIPKVPIPPSNPIMSLETGAVSGVKIQWNEKNWTADDFNNPLGQTYRIIRKDLKRGIESTIEIPIGDLYQAQIKNQIRDNTTGFSLNYTDSEVSTCESYSYKISTHTNCSKSAAVICKTITAAEQLSITNIDLSDTFIADNLLTSKGYYPEMIQLNWNVNKNASFVNQYKIYRRALGSTVSPELVASSDTNARSWEDRKSVPKTLYEYFIIAESDCGQEKLSSFPLDSISGKKYELLTAAKGLAIGIGFRSPVATITGNISYSSTATGGFAVPNVKVVAERDGQVTGNSLHLDGTNQYIKITPNKQINYSDSGFSTSLWLKPEELSSRKTLAKQAGVFELFLNNSKIDLSIGNNTIESDSIIAINTYTHIFVTATKTKLCLYINGKINKTLNLSIPATLASSAVNPIYLGSADGLPNAPFYKGLLDEFRVYKDALTPEEVLRDYSRVINAKDPKIAGYWRFDEGVGPMIFDASKESDVYHKHDGILINATDSTWATAVPEKEQLGYAGITDSNGNYVIEGIVYNGTGEQFKVTPTMTLSGSVHRFSPPERIVFLGDGQTIQNNQDFKDESSFRVRGRILFDFSTSTTNLEKTSGSSGVSIWIDGTEPFRMNSAIILTDADGYFDIRVPVGNHFLEFKKEGHTFEKNRFPYSGPISPTLVQTTYDFQDNLSGIEILDTTKHTLVGCVVGGRIQGAKKLGLSRYKGHLTKGVERINNIGQTYFTLTAQHNSNIVRTVHTDPETGDFEIDLPPNEYRFSDLKYVGDPTNNLPEKVLYQAQEIQNINLADKAAYDGISVTERIVEGNDTLTKTHIYNADKKFVFTEDPQITVKDNQGRNYLPNTANGIQSKTAIGESNVRIFDTASQQPVSIATRNLDYPLFLQGKSYIATIQATEKYQYYGILPTGHAAMDEIPVLEGEITANNSISSKEEGGDVAAYEKTDNTWEKLSGSTHVFPLQKEGTVSYGFTGGDPDLLTNGSDTFTKGLSLSLKVGTKIVYWPNATNQDTRYKAYLMGGKKNPGTNFITSAPVEIQTTLRMPPGSNSSITINKGSTFSTETSNSTSANSDWSNGFGLMIKTKVSIPMTALTLEEGEATNIVSAYGSNYNGLEKTSSFTNNFDQNFTISNPDASGNGDYFISSSNNLEIGQATDLKFVSDANCTDCYGNATADDGKTYTIKAIENHFQKETGKTFFLYSEDHIKTNIIPTLIALRNSYFNNHNNIYIKNPAVPESDPLFGLNNDDPRLAANSNSTNDYTQFDREDEAGSSYTFVRANAPADNGIIIDNVRKCNNEIRAWEEILMDNEIEKWSAIRNKSSQLLENVSISSGIAYNKTTTNSEVETTLRSSESMAGGSNDTSGYGLVGPGAVLAGIVLNVHGGGDTTSAYSNSNAAENHMTTSYSIQDNDPYNTYNLNVFKGKGNDSPIFQVVSGQTSCPFEDEKELEITKDHLYYLEYWISHLPEIIKDKEDNLKTLIKEEIDAINIQLSSLYCTSGPDYADCVALKNVLEAKKAALNVRRDTEISRISGLLNAKKEDYQTLLDLYQAQTKPLLGVKTVQIQKPLLKVNDLDAVSMFSVPSTKAAAFNLKLTNNTELAPLKPNNGEIEYQLFVDPASNPNGLVVLLNGETLVKPVPISIPFKGTILQTLTVLKGPIEYDYSNLKLILNSACDPDIKSEVTLNIQYIPVCPEANIISPGNKWTVNIGSKNKLPLQVDGYDINYAGFKKIRIQYKKSSESDTEWQALKTFYRNAERRAEGDAGVVDPNAPLLSGNKLNLEWDLTSINDGSYDIRLLSVCEGKGNADVIYTSPTISGIVDRKIPLVFGIPQPADGILNVDDDIRIKFNEPINTAVLTKDNFNILAVVNGETLLHPASVYFNGAADYMEIPDGIKLNLRSFSVDFYAKRNQLGAETLVSQGSSQAQSLQIGFNANNHFEVTLAGLKITSDDPILSNSVWHHYAFTYDDATQIAKLYIDALSNGQKDQFSPNYQASGKIDIAKDIMNQNPSFKGNIHELRFWGKALDGSQISTVATKRLTANEPHLLGNWRMEEAEGNQAVDLVRERNAEILSGSWELFLKGNALETKPNNSLTIASPNYLEDSNFSIEFWFKGNHTTSATLLSNGRGDDLDTNKSGWSIRANASGSLEVWNNNKAFQAHTADKNYFDNQWHHFALVVNRLTNTTCFIDGNQQNSIITKTAGFLGFGATKLHLGEMGWLEPDSSTKTDQAFEGALDEVRIWNGTRNALQIKRDMRFMLSGKEAGLDLYLPFDTYTIEQGAQFLRPSATSAAQTYPATEVSIVGNPSYTQNTPLVKLPRPVVDVSYNFTANQDEIILTTTEEHNYILENVVLDISAKNIQDLNGNTNTGTTNWTAYVDKNQVLWSETDKDFQIETGKDFTFETTIKNRSGKLYNFNINNLPSWLTASPASGLISPLSSMKITFTIDKNINIGNYVQDIQLMTEFGYADVMNLSLDVIKPIPTDWKVTPANYQFSMNLIAQLNINGEISRDPNDQLAAFVGDECRGIAKLKYIPALDRYEAYLNVYSNATSGEEIQFRIWKANDGQVYRDVSPSAVFESNLILGTVNQPQILSTTEIVLEHTYTLAKGWTWISAHLNYNYKPSKQLSTNDLFKPLTVTNGDLVRDIDSFDQYDPQEGWVGTLTAKGGIRNGRGYKIFLNKANELKYTGKLLKGDEQTINLTKGWNWIGYIGYKGLPINQALAGFAELNEGDVIKNQFAMAQYANNIGWIGDLSYLIPGEAYMMRTANSGSFKYPNISHSSSAGRLSANAKTTAPAVLLASTKYPNSMNLIAQVEGDNQTSQNKLRAYVGEELRAEANPVYNPNTKKQSYFLSIYGEKSTENIRFEFVDALQNKALAINESAVFNSDTVLGNTRNPQLLTLKQDLSTEKTVLAYPNPFSNYLKMKLYQEHKIRQIILFDLLGHQLMERAVESKELELDFDLQNLASGIYMISSYDASGSLLQTQRILKL